MITKLELKSGKTYEINSNCEEIHTTDWPWEGYIVELDDRRQAYVPIYSVNMHYSDDSLNKRLKPIDAYDNIPLFDPIGFGRTD